MALLVDEGELRLRGWCSRIRLGRGSDVANAISRVLRLLVPGWLHVRVFRNGKAVTLVVVAVVRVLFVAEVYMRPRLCRRYVVLNLVVPATASPLVLLLLAAVAVVGGARAV